MTPHELINLPYAGMAEKQLRKQGDWRKSAIDILYSIPEGKCTDKVNSAIDDAISILEAQEANT